MPIRILLIEDNPDHILFTKKILEKENGQFECDSVSGAKECLKKLIEENYGLVLCDYRMPGFTALDMLKEMHNREKDLPFVVVTASGNEKVAVDLMKEGAYDYIVKDVSYEDTLPVVIKRSIERFNAKKEKEGLEKKIKQVAEEWGATFDSITDLISIHNKDFKIVRVNKAFADMFKMNPEEIIGKACYDIFHRRGQPWELCPHKQALETKKSVRGDFFEPQLGIFFEVSVSPIINEKGEVVNAVHIAKDITKRKQLENNLKDSKEMLENITQGITDGVFLLSKDFEIIWANSTILKQVKLEFKDVIGKYCYEVTHNAKEPCNNISEPCPIKETLESGNIVTIEHTHYFADGSKQFVEVSASPVRNENGEIIQFVYLSHDITARKKAEFALQEAYRKLKETQQQLIQSSKMVAMGQLAAGISHELNQPLTGIKGFAQALLMDFNEKNPFREDLTKIVEQANRIDKIIKNVRSFARQSESAIEAVDLNETVEGAFLLINEQLKVHNILVNKSLDENLPKIKGDSNQLLQVFVNLITNARDAIECLQRPEGGTITVKTSLCQDNAYVQLILKDDGCGIDEKTLANIFNPFFTTKSPDKGMGLGLSIVYRIIEDCGGKINVQSQKGKGSIFTVTLPIDGKKNAQT